MSDRDTDRLRIEQELDAEERLRFLLREYTQPIAASPAPTAPAPTPSPSEAKAQWEDHLNQLVIDREESRDAFERAWRASIGLPPVVFVHLKPKSR